MSALHSLIEVFADFIALAITVGRLANWATDTSRRVTYFVSGFALSMVVASCIHMFNLVVGQDDNQLLDMLAGLLLVWPFYYIWMTETGRTIKVDNSADRILTLYLKCMQVVETGQMPKDQEVEAKAPAPYGLVGVPGHHYTVPPYQR